MPGTATLRSRALVLAFAATLVAHSDLLSAAAGPSPPTADPDPCVTFDDLTPGTHYNVGQTFTSNGVTVAVQAFTWSNGTVTSTGRANILAAARAGGSGVEVNANNVNLRFDFGGSSGGLSYLFGEYGGNLNIDVNGDFRNFDNFSALNNQTVGGVAPSVVNGFGNDRGRVTLNGAVQSFAVGGQELYLDNVCVGAAAAERAHEVSLYWGGFLTEDTLPLNAGFHTGFRYARYFRPTFSWEFETGIVLTDFVGASGLLAHAELHLRWHPAPATPAVRPFLLLGVGAATFNTTGFSESSPLVVLGLGADFRWRSDVGFRLDVRDVVLTDLFNVGATHNLDIVWGPVFWF